MTYRHWLLFAWAVCTNAATAAPLPPRITLLDGEAVLLVGTQALRAALGTELADTTLVETDASSALLRIEWPDGSLLDVGPETHLMLSPPRQVSVGLAFYLLRGWVKLSQPADSSRIWASPVLTGAPAAGANKPGVVVIWAQADRTRVFAETGAQTLTLRANGKPISLAAGHELALGADGQMAQSPRATPALLADLPAAFRVPLAARWAELPAKTAEPKVLPKPALSQLAPWLGAELALRRDLSRRWIIRLAEAEVRRAVDIDPKSFPDWAAALARERLKNSEDKP
jgi:hypothetical protein